MMMMMLQTNTILYIYILHTYVCVCVELHQYVFPLMEKVACVCMHKATSSFFKNKFIDNFIV